MHPKEPKVGELWLHAIAGHTARVVYRTEHTVSVESSPIVFDDTAGEWVIVIAPTVWPLTFFLDRWDFVQ